jgi:hypothetical protein
MRGSALAAWVTGGLLLLGTAFVIHGVIAAHAAKDRRAATRETAAALGLTDLALMTEARYIRHLSLADLHSAFQDAPMALEHFPSGSLITPPRRWPASHLRAAKESE